VVGWVAQLFADEQGETGMVRKAVAALGAIILAAGSAALAADAPSEIKIGTLYAASGTYASISRTVFQGLNLWVDQKNAEGGVFVKPFNKKIPIKVIAYDDQSNTATAATLYNQLITQDKVDILVADSGSVLTSVAVPLARDHKMFLFNQTGTGATFFTPDNPYIALMSDPASTVWPRYLAEFLTKVGPQLGIKRIAILYSTNDFTGTQANTVREAIKARGAPLEIVYDNGVPTGTSNYTVLINSINAANPDAVVQLGYPSNDIAFLRNLQDSGTSFKFLFCLYPGIETELLEKNVGPQGLRGVYSYVMSSAIEYKPNFGPTLPEYKRLWEDNAPKNLEFGFNSVAGYNTGLVIEKALATTESLEQLAIRKAVFDLSGKLMTLDGNFELAPTGAQTGEITPLGQFDMDANGHLKFVIVYPPEVATGKAKYPAESK
jgi:branched-chain amino acid transport system substrate-binding protein